MDKKTALFRPITQLAVALLILLVAGCAQIPRASVVGEQEQINIIDRPPAVANGAIYQSRRGYHPLFEDRRPRAIGDILTIVLDEQVSASQTSQSSANRSGSASLGLAEIPEIISLLDDYGYDVESDNIFSGSGNTQANNTMTGTITVSVLEVLNNGYLRVRGEKQIAINQGTEFIRFSGVVNPQTVTAANTVPSNQVADARIEYVGDGYINEAQHMGWLQRFFLNVSPF